MSAIEGVPGYPLPVLLASLLSTCSCVARQLSNGYFECLMFNVVLCPRPSFVLCCYHHALIAIIIIIKHEFYSYMASLYIRSLAFECCNINIALVYWYHYNTCRSCVYHHMQVYYVYGINTFIPHAGVHNMWQTQVENKHYSTLSGLIR